MGWVELSRVDFDKIGNGFVNRHLYEFIIDSTERSTCGSNVSYNY